MNVLRNLLFILMLTVGFSMSVSAQKNDQDKKPPKPPPPVVKPGEKPQRPPDSDNRPKKPSMALAKTSEENNVLFV